ncbi:MAG: hypothetical protein VX392_07400, partial [Verrucomicrobiota bacterium]|nr:hypothetical protein [Verrucomicrobiota bacterium]
DRTCNYGCQVTEYVYWALTSLLNGQDFKGRGENIEHEWKLNTPEKLRTKDKSIVKILTDPNYHVPTRLPDGKYRQMRKQAAVRLNIIADGNRFTLNTELPVGSTTIIETTHDLLLWSQTRRFPGNTTMLEFPIESNLGKAQFFRLRFDN